MADVVGSTLRIWHYHSCLCGGGERRQEIHMNSIMVSLQSYSEGSGKFV